MGDWIDRQREASEVYALLTNLPARGGGVLISGVAGSGKTTLARQIGEMFATRSGRSATWISGFSPDASSIFAEELVRAPQGHLVIIDGLDEARDHGLSLALEIRSGLQKREYLWVLATTRINPGLNDFRSFHLGPMLDADLQALLTKMTGSAEIPPRELLRLLDGHPLTASLVGNIVREKGSDYRSILSLLRDFNRPGLLDPSGRPISSRDARRERLVTDIRDANTRLLVDLKARPELVYQLSPRQFEEVSAEIFSRLGYNVKLTPRSKDGGVDIFLAQKTDVGSFLYFVECKQYAADRPVGIGLVNALVGVVERGKATAGLLMTTSRFTSGARSVEKELSARLSLKDYGDFKEYLEKVVPFRS